MVFVCVFVVLLTVFKTQSDYIIESVSFHVSLVNVTEIDFSQFNLTSLKSNNNGFSPVLKDSDSSGNERLNSSINHNENSMNYQLIKERSSYNSSYRMRSSPTSPSLSNLSVKPISTSPTKSTIPVSTSPPTQSTILLPINSNYSLSAKPFRYMNYITHYRVHPHKRTPHFYLIIVNFHWAKYCQVPFLRDTYFPKFLSYFQSDFDVVIVGPKMNEAMLVIGNRLPQGGYFSYYDVPFIYNLLCEQGSCEYDGFLFMNDDSYIDPQFLRLYDLTKSWSEPSVVCNPRKNGKWRWPFNKNYAGVPFYIAYENATKTLAKESVGRICQFNNSINNRRGYSDAFYLARKDIKIFNRIATVMFENQVFLEMATPSAMWCVTHSFFNDCNHGKMKNRQKCVHLHPIKYSKGNNQKLAMKRIDHQDMSIVPHVKY